MWHHVLAAVGVYSLLGSLMDGLAAPATAGGLLLAPHFDRPFVASSFSDLWGKRWNLVAGTTLRNLFYDPIIEGEALDPA
jgi:hypothetical protein